jgi:hypothetical protein
MRSRSPVVKMTSTASASTRRLWLLSTSANFNRKLLRHPLAPLIEAIFADPMLLANRANRLPALLLLRYELPPEFAPLFSYFRHAASIGEL